MSFSIATSIALGMLREIYITEDDELDWDELDWDKFFEQLDRVKTDRKSAIRSFKAYSISDSMVERYFAAQLAGVVMNPVEAGEEDDARAIIAWLDNWSLKEKSTDVLSAIAGALQYPYLPETKRAALRLSRHEDSSVRFEATLALNSLTVEGDEEVFARLRELTNDPEADIRDWAEFSLRPLPDD